MNCSKCNALIPDDAAFCPECGAPAEVPAVEEPVSRSFCPNCGAELQGNAAFCGNCGERLGAPVSPGTKHTSKKQKSHTGKKLSLKKLLFAVAGLAVIAAVAILVSSLFRGGTNSYVVYIKDNQLQYGELPKLENIQVLTTKLRDNNINNSYRLTQECIHMTDDGKKLFYPDRIEYDEYGYVEKFALYYRYIDKPKKDTVKIDSGISSYEINKNGTMIYYIKNGNLYQHDLKDKTKIDSDVNFYVLSEDEKSLLYTSRIMEANGNWTSNVYVMQVGKDPEKLLSGVSEIEYVSQDFSTLIFTKNDSLYVKHGNENAVKIASDIFLVLNVYESGELYYAKADQKEITHWDIIEDDMPGTDYSEYYSEYLSSYTMFNPLRTLYYYNGAESVVVAENLVDWHYTSCDRAVLVYDCYEGEALPKLKLSEYVDSSPSIDSWFHDKLDSNIASYVALGAVSEELDMEDICDVEVNAEGTVLYAASDIDYEYECCSMYKVVLTDDSVESCELLDDEVCRYSWGLLNNSIMYFKEVTEERNGELYINGNFVDEDVYVDYLPLDEKHNKLYYLKDHNTENELGTLTCYNGKEVAAIKDDVYSIIVTTDGDVLFLYDYNINYRKGELWILDGKKMFRLDEDVARIVAVN